MANCFLSIYSVVVKANLYIIKTMIVYKNEQQQMFEKQFANVGKFIIFLKKKKSFLHHPSQCFNVSF